MPDKEPKPPRFEMEIQLPHILTEPLKLEDGTILAEGDKVEHEELGVGTIVRIWAYDDIGVGLYVDFGNTVKKRFIRTSSGRLLIHPCESPLSTDVQAANGFE